MNKYLIIALVGFVVIGIFFSINRESPNDNEVVVYVAHDQDYSEPVLKAFEEKTGIKVKSVYDTEATKTVGLTNRLIAEKNNAQADVFWNNEVTRTIQLQREGVLDVYFPENYDLIDDSHKDAEGHWTGFAARARVLVVNTDSVDDKDTPLTLEALTDPMFEDKVTIADPRFGTTGSHLASLYYLWGKDKTEAYLFDLIDNGLDVAQSNGQTRDKAVSGEMWIGFTDTDDANDAVADGAPVQMVYTDQGEDEMGTLVIPNTVMLIKGAKNVDNAQKLMDYLVSAEAESMLAYSKAAQMPLLPDVDVPDNVPPVEDVKAMNVDWYEVYDNLAAVLTFVEENLVSN